uniref:Uncharacterized protein n=1 Tax=Timema genevievae TaxID=629358 RepID=A0A7R9PGZ0_TIMGE|nr:unnamed protein product [Timema genevievae]
MEEKEKTFSYRKLNNMGCFKSQAIFRKRTRGQVTTNNDPIQRTPSMFVDAVNQESELSNSSFETLVSDLVHTLLWTLRSFLTQNFAVIVLSKKKMLLLAAFLEDDEDLGGGVIFTKPALRLFNTEPKLRYAHAQQEVESRRILRMKRELSEAVRFSVAYKEGVNGTYYARITRLRDPTRPDQESNPDIPVIGSPVLHESYALDQRAYLELIGRRSDGVLCCLDKPPLVIYM